MLRKTLLIVALTAITTMPAWSQARTTPVEVTNEPTVKIDSIENAVKIDSAQNTVKIDPANNVISAPGHTSEVVPWSETQYIESGQWLYTNTINCSGYKELRVSLRSSTSSSSLKAYYFLYVRPVPSTVISYSVGYADFATPSTAITEQGNFTQSSLSCLFTVPVLANECKIGIYNGTGAQVSISRGSVIYLTN